MRVFNVDKGRVVCRCVVPFCPAESTRPFYGWICAPHFDLVDRAMRDTNSDLRTDDHWDRMAEQAIWRAACSPMKRDLKR